MQSPLGFETPYLHGQALNAVQEKGLEKLGEVLKENLELGRLKCAFFQHQDVYSI